MTTENLNKIQPFCSKIYCKEVEVQARNIKENNQIIKIINHCKSIWMMTKRTRIELSHPIRETERVICKSLRVIILENQNLSTFSVLIMMRTIKMK